MLTSLYFTDQCAPCQFWCVLLDSTVNMLRLPGFSLSVENPLRDHLLKQCSVMVDWVVRLPSAVFRWNEFVDTTCIR
jgi:hypothetical protein